MLMTLMSLALYRPTTPVYALILPALLMRDGLRLQQLAPAANTCM
jgi:hypothetical protein